MSAHAAEPDDAGASHAPLPVLRAAAGHRDLLRVAVLAPPWIPVPPPAYGGIEAVLDLLCEALVARGHEVTDALIAFLRDQPDAGPAFRRASLARRPTPSPKP